MLIGDLFERDVTRAIPPVVYFHEQEPAELKREVEEYIITGGYPARDPRATEGGIHEQFVRLLSAMARELGKPGGPELPACWISGFYGSGKSSFAKLLGLSLDGRRLPDGKPLAERAKTTDSEVPELEAQLRTVKAEIDRLGAALLATDEKPQVVVKMIAEREKRLAMLEARLASIRTAPSVLDLEVRRLEKQARSRLEDFRGLMGRNPDEARKALETLLNGPLRFTPIETPDGKRYRVEGEVGLEAMLAVEGIGRCTTDGVPSGDCSVLNELGTVVCRLRPELIG